MGPFLFVSELNAELKRTVGLLRVGAFTTAGCNVIGGLCRFDAAHDLDRSVGAHAVVEAPLPGL